MFTGGAANEPSTHAMTLMLWHSCFLLLFSEVGNTERASNLDDHTALGCTVEELKPWPSTETAKRCVIHALLVVQLLGCLRISDMPAMHVARTAWHAAIILAAYTHYGPGDQLEDEELDILAYPEIMEVRNIGVLSEADWLAICRNVSPRRCRASAYQACSSLRSLGPWGDAAYYASSLDRILGSLDVSSQLSHVDIES